MRSLRAKQISTNKWCQRIDTGNMSEADFIASVSLGFNIPTADLQAQVAEIDVNTYTTYKGELQTGTHQGLAVIASSGIVKLLRGRDFLTHALVPSLAGATTEVKLDRLAAVCIVDPAVSMVVNVCNVYLELTSNDHVFIRKLWSKKLAVGGLSLSEVTAIEAAASSYGITLP